MIEKICQKFCLVFSYNLKEHPQCFREICFLMLKDLSLFSVTSAAHRVLKENKHHSEDLGSACLLLVDLFTLKCTSTFLFLNHVKPALSLSYDHLFKRCGLIRSTRFSNISINNDINLKM